MSTATAERVQTHRQTLHRAGLRPVQIWVPDTRRPGFAEECRRQSLSLAATAAASAAELAMRRGNLVTIALLGDLGKPRPAVVIESDLFDHRPSVTVLPLTSEILDAPLLRITVQPNTRNGLRIGSQVMVDKPSSVMRKRLGPVFGRLDDTAMVTVNRALAVFIGLA